MLALPLLLIWLTGPLSFALLSGAGYVLYEHYYLDRLVEQEWLIAAAVALAFSFTGKWWILLLFRHGRNEPKSVRSGETHTLTMPDGARIHVEIDGDPQGTPLVLTHGWGLDSTAW